MNRNKALQKAALLSTDFDEVVLVFLDNEHSYGICLESNYLGDDEKVVGRFYKGDYSV